MLLGRQKRSRFAFPSLWEQGKVGAIPVRGRTGGESQLGINLNLSSCAVSRGGGVGIPFTLTCHMRFSWDSFIPFQVSSVFMEVGSFNSLLGWILMSLPPALVSDSPSLARLCFFHPHPLHGEDIPHFRALWAPADTSRAVDGNKWIRRTQCSFPSTINVRIH